MKTHRPSDDRELSSEHPADLSADVHEMHDPILREKERPRDGFQPIPTTLLLIFFALLMWGGWYLGTYSGDWRVDILDPEAEPRPGIAAGEPEGFQEGDLLALGERVYSQCAACHQQDGQGLAGTFPPLDGTDWVTGSPEVLARILLQGLQGPIEVNGEVYSGEMPAWGDQLEDRDIAAVMSYIRTSWTNEASEVEPELVGQVREETQDRTSAWTAEELEALPTDEAGTGGGPP